MQWRSFHPDGAMHVRFSSACVRFVNRWPGVLSEGWLRKAQRRNLTPEQVSNAVNTLVLGAPVAYDQGQMQTVIDKMNELIMALRR